MNIIPVNVAQCPYDVHVAANSLQSCGEMLRPFVRDGHVLVVTDDMVLQHVLPLFTQSLTKIDASAKVFSLPAGEGAKSWSQLEALTDWLLENHVERTDHIIALGGGVVGDITGFAAHIVKRGCSFVQIPTTLLAQVDSSVGGKTAINSRSGKNMVGAFQQPALVLIDPEVLNSLPPRQMSAGFAEVIKYGLIDDAAFFAWCEENLDKFFAGDAAAREYAIVQSVTSKARIVAADERETTGIRALLNLGHTFGHALEAETGFSDTLLHGEAVGAGMAMAFRYSARLGYCSADVAHRVSRLLARAHLPVTLKDAGAVAPGEVLVGHMLHDKKMSGGTLPFLLARGIGETFLSKDVDIEDVNIFLDEEAAL